MLKVLGALERLQKIDLELTAIEEEEKEYSAKMDSVAEELKAIEAEMEELGPDLDTLTARVKEYQDLIRQSSEKMTKDERRLNDVRNEKEFGAINREIRSANRAKRQYEDELENVRVKAEELQAKMDEKEAAVGEKKDELEGLTNELEEKRAGWKETLEARTKEREEVSSGIRPDVLRKYDRIRKRRGGRGLAPVKDETCQGCFIGIPPQTYIELRKGAEELILCPHCHRILYFDFEAEAEADNAT